MIRLTADSRKISGRFIYYYTLSKAYAEWTNMIFIQATIQNISAEKYSELHMPVPPLPQQDKIIHFLDVRCAEIDAIIAAKQRQNELLKEQRQSIIFEAVTKGLDPTVTYKDSGVEWIGEIPTGWEVFKIKHIVTVPVTDGPHESPQLVDEGIPFISAEAVKGNKLDFSLMRGYISKEDHEVYCKKVRPQREDIFVVKSGATTGAIAIVDTDDEFSIWSPLALVRSKKPDYSQRFVYYAMLSDSFRKQIELGWNFGTQQNLGMNVLENLFIACPLSTIVQQQIADFLDTRCTELDRVVAANNAVIDKLKEYRQSLIYEAVTGKIAV
jgi:type I restriction enzyme S subunit